MMKHFFFKSVLLIFLYAISGTMARGQEDCSFTLEKAQKLFQEGKIREIPSILNPCIEDGFNSEERISAYKLIILSYIADDNKDEAQRQMLYFLRKYPEYKLLPTDAVEFLYLYDSYNTFPVFTIGIFGGLNYSNVNVINPFGTHSLSANAKTYSSSGGGLSGGIRFSKHINKNIDVNLEIMYEKFQFKSVTKTDSSYTVTFEETDSRIMLPISITYTFMKVPYIQPYLRFGLAPGMTVSSSATIRGVYTDNQLEKTGPDVDIIKAREKYGLWGIAGGGLRYKIPRGYLFLDVRYNYGFFNNVNSESRTNENLMIPILAWKYNYQDDNFKLNNLQFTLGYSFIFYKPEKKKK